MNWGHGITIGFGLFVAYILYFVFTSFQHDIDLVAEDYYAQEVAFQDRIDNEQNAAAWAQQITVFKAESGILLSFPPEAIQHFIKGEVHFFRPSDTDLDRKLPLAFDADGQMFIPAQLLQEGRYEVLLSWEDAEQGYFVKKDLFN